MILDFDKTLQNFKILSNTIIPRPIAWLSTFNIDKSINLAPFSFFGVINVNPAILSISIMEKADQDLSPTLKDSMKNLLDSKIASVSMCNLALLPLLEKSSASLPYGKSEAKEFDIALQNVCEDSIFPSIPSGVEIAFMCKLYDVLDFTTSKTALLKVEKCYIKNEFYKENLDLNVRFVSRVGKEYHTIGSKTIV